ncbi:MAG: sulfurtransferase [Chloroflexi bacterium]|nr:sulfurtransferase [Chloroflexota bacterium]
MNTYPSDLLVDSRWLVENLTNSNLRILDVRGMGYRLGHIPQAIALDLGRDFFIFAGRTVSSAPPEHIAQALSKLGVANDTTIVLYDDTNDQPVALAYWSLRHIGHRDVKILHGGFIGWRNAGSAVSHDVPSFTPSQYRPQINDDLVASAEWIQANENRADVLLLDVRSYGEYVNGHIPHAVNLPYDSSLNWQTMFFREAEKLRAQFESVGATPDKEIVVYCHTGMRSAHAFLTLSLMGYPRMRNYAGSMADWYETRQLPIE